MNVYIGGTKDYSAMQGPCDEGFHIPFHSEWNGIKTIMNGLNLTTGDQYRINLHLPLSGVLSWTNGNIGSMGTLGRYWCSNNFNASARIITITTSSFVVDTSSQMSGYNIRPFKNEFVAPDSSWTVIQGTLGSAGIFRDETNGLISITGDGTTGYTISDKNLGATTVYSDGDTLSESNCGKFYQRGNNYGFAFTGATTKSTTKVDASGYGPGNYYSSSTFIYSTGNDGNWSSVRNDNLRGGVTGIVSPAVLKNAYIGEAPIGVGIYHNSTLGLISLSSDGENWITISDKNLGATTVYNDGDALSQANCGKYYQWGNNYGFPFTGSITTSSTKVDASNYGPGNYYSSSTYITGSYDSDWSSVQNDNLWGYTTGTNAAMQGPCASGYHVPTKNEWVNVYNIGIAIGAWVAKDGNNYKKYLKLPLNGTRTYYNGGISGQGTYGNYWSCQNRSTGYAYISYMSASELDAAQIACLCKACSIRPFANTSIKPGSTREILYQPS